MFWYYYSSTEMFTKSSQFSEEWRIYDDIIHVTELAE